VVADLTNVKNAINKERTARRALARLLAIKGNEARSDPKYHDLVVEIDMAQDETDRLMREQMPDHVIKDLKWVLEKHGYSVRKKPTKKERIMTERSVSGLSEN